MFFWPPITCTRTVTAANPDGTITCRLGTLPAGATATVTITVTPTIEGGTLTSTARVTATNVSKDTNDQSTLFKTGERRHGSVGGDRPCHDGSVLAYPEQQ